MPLAERGRRGGLDSVGRLARLGGMPPAAPSAKEPALDSEMATNKAPDIPGSGSQGEHLADTEQALRDSEAQLRSIIETVPDAIILIDERGLIQSFSPAAERLFGYTAREVLGRNVSMLMPSPYREQHDEYLARYLRTGERRIIGIGRVVVGQRADGSTFPMELAVGEARQKDRRLFTGFVRDITERQTARERLQELQSELLRTSRLSAMGQMASALAHELNQPLTAVINYVQACRRLLGEGHSPPERVLEIMDRAVIQASRAGQIIQRMRQFIQKGETERQIESINKVVEEASALALVGAQESGILVRMELSPDLPPLLLDRIQIQQVLVNLVRNAIEAMTGSERRELTIRTGQTGAAAVEVAVADTGPGLSAEVKSQLFQPFVTTKPKGMGLGLSISRSIIEAHGGRLQGEANAEGGVTFRFSLPVRES
jgi:two-component system, LuxR family, sensor kinase FixL